MYGCLSNRNSLIEKMSKKCGLEKSSKEFRANSDFNKQHWTLYQLCCLILKSKALFWIWSKTESILQSKQMLEIEIAKKVYDKKDKNKGSLFVQF